MFSDAKSRITYGELKDKVERCAEFLRRIGIKRGDVVTIQLPNRIDFPIVFFALELIGAIANKVNPDFRARELEYILKFSNSSAFVCPSEFKSFDYVVDGEDACNSRSPSSTHVIVAGGAAEGTHDLDPGIARVPADRHGRPGQAWTPTRFSAWRSRPGPPAIPSACCTRSTRRSTPATC